MPTVNLGERQQGREKPASVIDCRENRDDIVQAIKTALSDEFQAGLPGLRNIYGEGGASEKIVEVLCSVDLRDACRKRFNDLECSGR